MYFSVASRLAVVRFFDCQYPLYSGIQAPQQIPELINYKSRKLITQSHRGSAFAIYLHFQAIYKQNAKCVQRSYAHTTFQNNLTQDGIAKPKNHIKITKTDPLKQFKKKQKNRKKQKKQKKTKNKKNQKTEKNRKN